MYFLVDFENVKSGGLYGAEYLEAGDYLTIFFSEAAHICERRYLDAIENSGCTFDTCKLKKSGKNGLDFYIATRVGEFYGNGHKEPAAIISKDQGFRAVRDYWDARNKKIILISIPPLCGGTNSDERFHFPLHYAIIVSRSYTTKHGRRSCRNLSRFKTAF